MTLHYSHAVIEIHMHSKNVFVTSCHLRCVTTADVQLPSVHRIPTHTNGSKAVIAITVVIKLLGTCMYVDKYRLLACCLKCKSGNQVTWYVHVHGQVQIA